MTSPDLFEFLEQTWRPWTVRLICCGRDDGEYRALTWEEADQFRESYTSGGGVASHWSRPWEGHVRSAIITEWPPVYVPPEGCTCMSPHWLIRERWFETSWAGPPPGMFWAAEPTTAPLGPYGGQLGPRARAVLDRYNARCVERWGHAIAG